MKKFRTSRFFSVVLSIVLVVSLAPSFTWANTPTGGGASQQAFSGLAQLAQPGQVLRLGTNATGAWEVGGTNFPTLAEAVAAANSGDTVTLTGGNINETTAVSIPSGKNITIDLGGNTVDVSLGDTSKTFITTDRGSTLTIKNGTLAGNQDGRALYLNGTTEVTLDSLAFTNFKASDNGGAIYSYDSNYNSKLTIAGSTFSSNNAADSGGAIYSFGTQLNVSRTSFDSNSCEGLRFLWSGGGAVWTNGIYKSEHITFDSCEFINNHANTHGGAIEVFGVMTPKPNIDINNSRFDGNSSEYNGGGIGIIDVGEMTVTNTVIENNETRYDGALEHTGVPSATGQQKKGKGGGIYLLGYSETSSLVLDNVTLEGNKALSDYSIWTGRGGGISISVSGSCPGLQIKSAQIIDNQAQMGGGIDYTDVNQPVLNLPTTLVTGNTAVRGGGVWVCPDGRLFEYATLGGDIYGNTAAGDPIATINNSSRFLGAAGDDVVKEGDDSKDWRGTYAHNPASISIHDYLGNKVAWYKDEADARYQTGDAEVNMDYYKTYSSFALHSELTTTPRNASEYSVVISGNTAIERGGGIATNSPVNMGVAEDINLFIKKGWEALEHPNSTQFGLYRTANGSTELIETATLNQANNWEWWFANLPAYSIDAQGNRTDYTWFVEEIAQGGWAVARQLTVKQYEDADEEYYGAQAEFAALVVSGTDESNTTKKFAFFVSDYDGETISKPALYHEPFNDEDAVFDITTDANGNWTVDGSDFPLWAVDIEEDGWEADWVSNSPFPQYNGWGPAAIKVYTFMEWDEEAEEWTPLFTHTNNYGNNARWGATRTYNTFVNSTVEPIEESIPVTKKIGGSPKTNETFTFSIAVASEGAPMPTQTTATITGAGEAEFGPITFNKAGTYSYTITETEGGAAGYTYDPAVFTVTYEVVLDGTELSATRSISKAAHSGAEAASANAVEFINSFAPQRVSETLEVEKVIESETATSADETFTFELAPIATQPDNPMPANAQDGKAQATIDHTGKTSFDAITFIQMGNYTYTVREVAGNAAGYTYDTTEYEVTFVVSENEGKLQVAKVFKERAGENLVDVEELSFKNTYTVESTTVAGLEVSKTIEGEKPAKDATFDFVLERTDDTYPMPEDAEGSAQLISVEGASTASFGQITFEEEGTYTYTVREIATNAAGYTYDKAVYTVSYHVVVDHNTAKLVATPTITKDGVAYESSAALAFTNSYKHIPNTADGIVVTKNLDGDTPEHAQDFAFTLAPVQENNPMPQDAVEGKAHISIHGAEAGAFGTIAFETPGTYAYTVTEETGTATGYTYDKAAFTVTYTVTAGEEELGIARAITKAAEGTDATAATEVAFINTFKHTPVQASIPVAKTISGSTPAPEETFAFVLTAEGESDPLPASTRVEIKGAGKAEFGPITFDASGTYKYNIEEVLGTADGYTYDNSVHEVAFVVDEVNGVLQATPSYLRDGQVVQGVSFNNEYTAPSAPVDVVLVKHLLNALINKGEFAFGLYDEQGKQYGETIHTVLDPTLTNPATDQYTSFVEIAFQDLIYYEPGVYKYTIREHTEGTTEVVEGDKLNQQGFEPGFYKGGVKYDDKEYPVVVTVLPDEEGKLVANVEYPEAEGDRHELVNEYSEEYVEIDGNDDHYENGLHEDPVPGPTPEPTPPSGDETTDNTGDNTPKKDDGKKTTKTVPKTGSVRTEDTNPIASLALVALVAAGMGVFAFTRRRKKE